MRILITGITGNLGQTCAEHFSSHEIVGISRNVSPHINKWTSVRVDLTDYEKCKSFCKSQKPFDLIIMTHGVQKTCLLSDVTCYDYGFIIGGNLMSAIWLTSSLTLHEKLAPNSLIVYCSSIQATQPREGRALYAIAKAGLETLAKSAAVELAPNTRAIALRLGQMTKTMKGVTFTQDQIETIQDRTLLPWVDSQDIATLIHVLYAQPSLTGETIEISSGHRFNIWK